MNAYTGRSCAATSPHVRCCRRNHVRVMCFRSRPRRPARCSLATTSPATRRTRSGCPRRSRARHDRGGPGAGGMRKKGVLLPLPPFEPHGDRCTRYRRSTAGLRHRGGHRARGDDRTEDVCLVYMVFGGCQPTWTHRCRAWTARLRFICKRATVARPVAVVPMICDPSSLHRKCSSHCCWNGLNSRTSAPVCGSIPV
jgi:hypothetical protein